VSECPSELASGHIMSTYTSGCYSLAMPPGHLFPPALRNLCFPIIHWLHILVQTDKTSIENRQHFPKVQSLPQVLQTPTAPPPSLFTTVFTTTLSCCDVTLFVSGTSNPVHQWHALLPFLLICGKSYMDSVLRTTSLKGVIMCCLRG